METADNSIIIVMNRYFFMILKFKNLIINGIIVAGIRPSNELTIKLSAGSSRYGDNRIVHLSEREERSDDWLRVLQVKS